MATRLNSILYPTFQHQQSVPFNNPSNSLGL